MKVLPPPPNASTEHLRLIHVAPAGRRRRYGARWWHKWIGVVVGVMLLCWSVSGLAILLPPSTPPAAAPAALPAIAWAAVVISPAQAAHAATRGADTLVRSLVLRRILDSLTYVVRLTTGTTSFVNAASGRTYSMTDTLASHIAAYGGVAKPVGHATRVTSRPSGYRGGLPAWRVEFDDGAESVAYVSEVSGAVERSASREGMRDKIIRVGHHFEPLDGIRGGAKIKKALLAASCAFTIIYVLLGFWLALPKRIRGTSR